MKLKAVLGCMLLWGISLGHADIADKDAPNGQNIFIVTLDGFRWQELFGGADSLLINNPAITPDTSYTKAMYWASSVEERRERLMPFFWNVLSKKGQVFGNRNVGSKVNTKNPYFLSYPGYNEIFTGEADPLIASNEKVKNKNTNLLEYINKLPEYAGKVAAIASWDAMPYILNKERSGFFINGGNEAVHDGKLTHTQAALNAIQEAPEYAEDATRNDMLTFLSAKEYIKKNKPKVMFVGLSGTDDASHAKKYDQYLKNANDADRIIAGLWNLVQSIPDYKDNTTFIITTDHGRGQDKETWHNHGFFVKGSSQTWIAMLGNNIRPLGECKVNSQLYQRNIAGTIGYLLGVKTYSRHMLPLTLFEKDPAAYVAKR
ncbi:MAG: hypothetical protein JWP88_2025 [Flaviaesturariibacter sp.]|nr:hypothetical protein [Flaviaesturariibacter sp.]